MKEANVPLCEETHHHASLLSYLHESENTHAFQRDLAEFFKVFADPTRVRILMALDRADLCVCDLTEGLGMTKSAVSHQLAALRAAHLVTYTREGKNVRYALADHHVRLILECAAQHLREPN